MNGALLSLLAAASFAQGVHQWDVYANARYGTRLAYPSDMFGRGVESDNGDGVSMRARDGATLSIFGFWNMDEGRSGADYVRGMIARDPRYRRITYRDFRPNFAIVSGVQGGNIYYERYAFGDRSGAIHAFVLTYPASLRARYDPIIARMSASLTWRPVSYR